MKIPFDSIIPLEKITKYLLVFNNHGDKSAFLARGGYTLENWSDLESDIRNLLRFEAVFQKKDIFGDYYVISGPLKGNLWVKTIWFREHEATTFRFITLFPQ
ncbi:MAG: hypothetical protein IT259_07970 [Saprospiraceae bacterium]|nr:hypothetical protein [Saprospiraceae bacterium]